VHFTPFTLAAPLHADNSVRK